MSLGLLSYLQHIILGIEAIPIPYSFHNDTLITSMLLVCLLLTIIAFGTARGYLFRELTSFIYKKDYTHFFNTITELHIQYLLGIQNVILISLSTFMILGSNHNFDKSSGELWKFTGIVFLYFIAKFILYYIVNQTFFNQKDTSSWHHSLLLLSDFEGLLLLPVVSLQIFANLSVKISLILALIVLFFVKILTIFKSYNIFFNKVGGFFQIILYFCTLEMIPCLILYGILD